MTAFTLASLLTDAGVRPAIGLADGYHPFPDALLGRFPTLKAVLEDWDAAFAALQTFADAAANNPASDVVPAADARLDAPVRYPNKLIAAGANYRGHLAEMGLPVVRFDPIPIYLMPPTTCMVGPGRTVEIPKTTEQFDWEIELVVVIGARLKDATLDEAANGVAGYTIALDLSARDLIQIGPPFHIDLVRGKAQDTMTPVGPVILPKPFLSAERGLTMRLHVNDRLMIDSNTADMIFDIPEILAHISRYITLEPGDMILTGSPEGSGVHHNYFLQPGDRISGSIAEIGSLDVEIKS